MEIDKGNLIEISKEANPNVFEYNYEGQILTNNPEFDKFTQKMKKKIGNNAKLFKCKKDKVYFYHDYSIFPYYTAKCPICNKSICYFCLNYNEYNYDECCLIKRIYYMFTVDGYIFFDTLIIKYSYKFKEYLIYALIPFINFVYIIGGIKISMLYNMGSKKSYKYYKITYYDLISGRHPILMKIIIFLDIISSIILSLCYIIINVYFIIFILIISFPFKFIPMKYFLGVPFSGWKMIC